MIRHLMKKGFSQEVKCMSQAKDKMIKDNSFVWIDLEMTGLEVEKHHILEAACIITPPDLKPVHEGLRLVIHQPEEVLSSMSPWPAEHHLKSGLTSESRESKISLPEADKILSDYIKLHSNPKGERFLAGNSVYMDKIFLEKYMPISNSLLHYRLVDVSCVNILCKHWYPVEHSKLRTKNKSHRAIEDIKESITELKDLKKIIFKTTED